MKLIKDVVEQAVTLVSGRSMVKMFLKINGWIAGIPFILAALHYYRFSDRWDTVGRSTRDPVTLWCIVGFLLAILFLRKSYRMSAIVERGVSATGSIESRVVIGFLQILAFTFVDRKGAQRRVANLQFDRGRHQALSEDHKIDVLYDPLDPDHAYWRGDLLCPQDDR